MLPKILAGAVIPPFGAGRGIDDSPADDVESDQRRDEMAQPGQSRGMDQWESSGIGIPIHYALVLAGCRAQVIAEKAREMAVLREAEAL